MANLFGAVAISLIAKEIAMAARAKSNTERTDRLLNIIESIVSLYRNEESFMERVRALVN